MNKNTQYHKLPNNIVFYEEPKVSKNYITNYTKIDNKIVHNGKANKYNNKYMNKIRFIMIIKFWSNKLL